MRPLKSMSITWRRHGDKPNTFEIADSKHRCSGFRRGRLELRGVDFSEALRIKKFAEESLNGGLKLEDSLICGRL